MDLKGHDNASDSINIILAVVVSVHLSVTSQCSKEMAKHRIIQTMPHELSAKLKWGHPHWKRQMQVG